MGVYLSKPADQKVGSPHVRAAAAAATISGSSGSQDATHTHISVWDPASVP